MASRFLLLALIIALLRCRGNAAADDDLFKRPFQKDSFVVTQLRDITDIDGFTGFFICQRLRFAMYKIKQEIILRLARSKR